MERNTFYRKNENHIRKTHELILKQDPARKNLTRFLKNLAPNLVRSYAYKNL
jgi:hypothetical protein